jgi:hypothetical protein
MRWWMNPFALGRAARDIKSAASGGGPTALRLCRVDHPKGWIFPAATVSLEVVGKDGRVTPIETALPVPFAFAWAYRLARKLGVPLIKDLKPEHVAGEVKVPGRS